MLDVLAFAAHPDDVELACAGTMLRFSDAGMATGIVDLTAGERGSRGTPELRAEEAERASALMGLSVRETLAFPDTELQPTLAVRRAVIEAIRRHRPTIVLAPYWDDLHPDHAAAGRAVREAFYPSGMKNVTADGSPCRPSRLFHYFLHDEVETSLVVDVSEVWARRIDVAMCFASQIDPNAERAGVEAFPTLISRPDFLPRIEARARAWGRRAGVTMGEPLLVSGALPVTDVRALLTGGAK